MGKRWGTGLSRLGLDDKFSKVKIVKLILNLFFLLLNLAVQG
jgi:hypothetical protein